MLDYQYVPAKLLIGIVGRNRGDHYVKVAKAAGARGGTVAPAHSLCGGRILQALALGDVLQDVVLMLLGAEEAAVISAIKAAAASEPKKMAGMCLVLDVSGMRLRRPITPAEPAVQASPITPIASGTPVTSGELASIAPENVRSEQMSSYYNLITVIVNSGYANEIMAEARKAGATGGTILTARGTGTQEDVKFFSITLVPEKDILMIVTEEGTHDKILAAINLVPVLSEPGGGIVYCQNVDEFFLMGGQG